MIKRILIVFFSFSLFACTDPMEEKVVAYCLDAQKIFESGTKENCTCLYNEMSNTLSKSEITEMVKVPFGSINPNMTEGDFIYITAVNHTNCWGNASN